MLFTGSEWTTIVSDVVVGAVLLSTMWKWLKSHDPKLANEVPAGIKKDLNAVEQIGLDLAKSPWFASAAAAGKIETKHILDALNHQHLMTLASQAVAATEKPFAELSQIEQGTMISEIQVDLKAFRADFTASDIAKAIVQVEKDVQTLLPNMEKAKELSQAIVAKA